MRKRIFVPNYQLAEPYYLSVIHRIVSFLCLIPVVFYLLRCYAFFASAWNDWQKFKDLGFPYSLSYHLSKSNIMYELVPFLCVAIEYAIYIFEYRRAEKKKLQLGSVVYFGIMLLIHITAWFCVSPPGYSSDVSYVSDNILLHASYHRFTKYSIVPSIVYFIIYLLRILHNRTPKYK